MKKKEFIIELEIRLKGIDRVERQNILNYYDELISDKMDEGLEEERVIRNLGTFEEIMRKLSVESNSEHKIKYDSLIEDEMRKEDYHKHNADPKMADSDDEIPVENTLKENSQKAGKKDYDGRTALIIILLVISAPIWLSFVMGAISVIFAAMCIIVSFMIAGVCLIVGGIFAAFISVYQMTISPVTGCFSLGVSLFVIGLGCLFTPLTTKGGTFLFKQMGKAIRYCIKLITKGDK